MENFKVYVHINKNNNKAYVGMTKQNPEYRWGSQGQGYRAQPKFYNAIQKYGWNNFEHLILADNIKSEEEALEIESYYIEIYDSIENGYNILPKGIVSYPRSKPVFCITTQTKYNSIKEAAEKTGCLPTAIIENCKGKVGPVKKLQWTYWNTEKEEPYPVIDFVPKLKPNRIRIYCIETNTYYNSIGEACRILNVDERGMRRALNHQRIGIDNKHFVKENEMDQIKELILKDTGNKRRVYCEELDKIFYSFQEAADYIGQTPQSVMKNCQKKTSSCANYHFKYVSEMNPDFILEYYRKEKIEEDEPN